MGEHTEPCRELQHFQKDMQREHSDSVYNLEKMQRLMEQQGEMILQNDKRISLIEQQNKLTFWVYGVIMIALIGSIVKLIIVM